MCECCFDYDEDSITSEEADRRVADGIEWLNTAVGLFWRRLVDVETLDINSVTRCVLGQVFAEYAHNPEYLNMWYGREFFHGYGYASDRWGAEVDFEAYGFTGNEQDMPILTKAWKRALS
jgi:hypothetical protein